jgi:perosamine synthetase
MLKAISRYGARVIPNTLEVIEACRRRGVLVQGPAIEAFEAAFATRLGAGEAISASYGRMAFHYILKALDLPEGSEIVFPALTFWVVPEIARINGLKVVFADVDRRTFALDPDSFERAITPKTRAVVPTHLFGLPCDMKSISQIASRHGLAVIEDCAHALGARYRGQAVGTFGHAGFFSFQTLKPLNTYGGGMATVRDPTLGARVRTFAAREPWPSLARIRKRLRIGRVQRILIRPDVFTWTLFPLLWAWSLTRSESDIYMWEAVRPLSPFPDGYRERYSNVQAALGLEALKHLDEWTELTRKHANTMTELLADLPGVDVPFEPADRTHVYYQYCLHVACDRNELVRRALRHGVDLEMRHVDVCAALALFSGSATDAPNAEHAAKALQVPVYSLLTDEQVRRVASVIRGLVEQLSNAVPSGIQRARV